MASVDANPISSSALFTDRAPIIIAVLTILSIAFISGSRRPNLPQNVPTLVKGIPFVGAWDFFPKRWEFYQSAMAKSMTGSFSFWLGKYPVIGLSGEEARRVFFESRDLHFNEGYRVLMGGSPGDRDKPVDSEYFQKRLVALMKGGALRTGLPKLVNDVCTSLDKLESDPSKIIEPFDVIYQIVFQLTMRTVGCDEIADDPGELKKMLYNFEVIESCGDKPLAVMYPGLWTYHSIRRIFAGIKLYTKIDSIAKDRRQSERRGDDALQFLLDQGDNTMNIIEFILGALFAGQLNSGINAAWLILHLSRNQYWHDRLLSEVRSVAEEHNPDTSIPLRERLAQLPLETWESKFPNVDVCLKECIRLSMNGTAFRRNVTDRDVQINKSGEVIPPMAFATYHIGDVHYNPNIYSDPFTWDPSRYLPSRAEDQKEKYAWVGWGVASHPCLGKRFARLEMNIIVAFWLAYFDSEVVDKSGNVTDKIPRNNWNASTAKKPLDKSYIKYKTRSE